MKLRETNALQARKAILSSAREEFETHGFEGASMRRIASEAGLATGTLFNYAKGKLDLLRQVLFMDLQAASADAVAVPRNGPVREQLVAMARVFLVGFAKRPDLSRVLLKESLFATGEDGTAFREQVAAFASEVEQRITAAFERGETAVDPRLAVLGFVSAYYFALISCLSSDSPDPEAALHLLDLQLGPALGVTS